MKQNEKVLVYAVTGFLLVILGIAILFGKDGPRRAAGPVSQQQPVASDHGKGLPEWFAEIAKNQAANADATKGAGVAEDGTQTGLKAPDDKPLVVTPPPTPAEEVHLRLGESRRERDCRIVKALPGDSLTLLTQRWCGSARMVDQVRSLNEGLQTLNVGQDVVMPWVDDATLVAAMLERQAPAPSTPGAAPASNPVPSPATGNPGSPAVSSGAPPVEAAGPSRLYKLQSGDKLWNIAVKEVGSKGAPAFLEQVKKLNPQIADINSIKAGQELRLPAKG